MSDLTDLDANRKAFVERLHKALGKASSRSFAKRAGISPTAMNQYLSGKNEPTRLVLIAIATTAEVSVEWLTTGNGPMRPDETPPASLAGSAPAIEFNETLMGQVADGITAAYKDMGQAIAPIQLGRLAARLHNEIAAVAEGPEDFSGALKMRLAQLRQELRAAAADPTSSKRRA